MVVKTVQLRVEYIAAGALTHKSLSITQAVRPSLISKTNGENASALLKAGALYLPPPSRRETVSVLQDNLLDSGVLGFET